jgi:lathosterol oxidase
LHWIGKLAALEFAALSIGFFLAIYLATVAMGLLFTRLIFPWLGLGQRLDVRAMRPKQVVAELAWSLSSVVVFGLGSLSVWWGVSQGLLSIESHAAGWRIAVECLLLVLWNDIHFYACHWLLHRPALFKHVHFRHHRSQVVTPFAIYSFHPIEAAMLGSVMPIAMLFWDFSAAALLFLPLYSIVVNLMGHSNYDLFPSRRTGQLTTFSRRHQMHHAQYRGNFGFMLPWLDRLLRTRVVDIPP